MCLCFSLSQHNECVCVCVWVPTRACVRVCVCVCVFSRVSIGYKNKVKTGETEGGFLQHIEKIHTTSYLLSIWSLIETRTDLDPSVWSLMGKSRGFTMECLAAFNEVFDFSPAAFNWALGALGRCSWESSKWVGAGLLVPRSRHGRPGVPAAHRVSFLYPASPLAPMPFVLGSQNIENEEGKTTYWKTNHTFFPDRHA